MKTHVNIILVLTAAVFWAGSLFAAKGDDPVRATGKAVVKPVKVVAETTGEIVETGLKRPQSIVFDSLETIKEGTNEMLPEGMEFVGNEPDEQGKDPGPKVRMSF